MAEQTRGDIEIDASPGEVMAVIMDFEAYPQWAQGIKKSEVRKTDSKGRGVEVYQEAGSMGLNAQYTLVYEYMAQDAGLSWTSKDASGVVKSIEGQYALEPKGDKSKVTYSTTMELAIPMVGFMKRQAERQIIGSALGGLKKRVERG